MEFSLQPLLLSFELSLITTVLLLLIGIPISHFLAYHNFRFKSGIEAIISLPLVLPPSVLGFYLLIAFSPNHFFGSFLEQTFNLRIIFSFSGLVIVSMLYSLSFMFHPLHSVFVILSDNLI